MGSTPKKGKSNADFRIWFRKCNKKRENPGNTVRHEGCYDAPDLLRGASRSFLRKPLPFWGDAPDLLRGASRSVAWRNQREGPRSMPGASNGQDNARGRDQRDRPRSKSGASPQKRCRTLLKSW